MISAAKAKRPERRKNPRDSLRGRRKAYFRPVRIEDINFTVVRDDSAKKMPQKIIRALRKNPHAIIRFKVGVDAYGKEIFGVAKLKNPTKPNMEEILLLTTRRAGAK